MPLTDEEKKARREKYNAARRLKYKTDADARARRLAAAHKYLRNLSPEQKDIIKERNKKWRFEKYHSDPEFRERIKAISRERRRAIRSN